MEATAHLARERDSVAGLPAVIAALKDRWIQGPGIRVAEDSERVQKTGIEVEGLPWHGARMKDLLLFQDSKSGRDKALHFGLRNRAFKIGFHLLLPIALTSMVLEGKRVEEL